MPRDESIFLSGSIYYPSAEERVLQGIVHVTIFSYTYLERRLKKMKAKIKKTSQMFLHVIHLTFLCAPNVNLLLEETSLKRTLG